MGFFYMAYVISAVSAKSGTGKTTLSINLAWILSDPTKRVPLKILFIDAGYNGTATREILMKEDLEETGGLGAVLQRSLTGNFLPPEKNEISGGDISGVFSGKNKSLRPSLHIIQADQTLSRVDEEYSSRGEETIQIPDHPLPVPIYSLLAKLIEPIEYRYDLILVDTPSHPGLIQKNCLYYADYFITPLTTDPESFYGFTHLVESLESENSALVQKKKIWPAVFTLFFRSRSTKDASYRKILKSNFENFCDSEPILNRQKEPPLFLSGPEKFRRISDKKEFFRPFASGRSKSAIKFKKAAWAMWNRIQS